MSLDLGFGLYMLFKLRITPFLNIVSFSTILLVDHILGHILSYLQSSSSLIT